MYEDTAGAVSLRRIVPVGTRRQPCPGLYVPIGEGIVKATGFLTPDTIAMIQHQHLLKVKTTGKSFVNITSKVKSVVSESGVQTGLCTLFLRHTSASLVIQENADPDVLIDLANFFADLVPETRNYLHSTEGPDDMPAHIRTALTHSSEQIPITQGYLVLGTWQGIYVWEHRQRGSVRDLVVHISGQ